MMHHIKISQHAESYNFFLFFSGFVHKGTWELLFDLYFSFLLLRSNTCIPLPQEENLEYFDLTPPLPKFYNTLCEFGNGRFLSFHHT